MLFDRKDIPLHMVTCPKRIVQCNVPGCHDVMRQSEMMGHNRDKKTKHLDLYATDEQKKAWSLKEVSISSVMIIKHFTYRSTMYSTASLL